MKIKIIKIEYIFVLFLCILIFGGFCYVYQRDMEVVSVMMPTDKKTIIIDAGHGGWDPGKTTSCGEEEKDINLKIAENLQKYLEQGGANVIITRNDDNALGNKKCEDMKERKEIVNNSNGDILISIHQNSFPNAKAKGAQVFYYGKSENGSILADSIQGQLINFADPENIRGSKLNSSYYILKNTNIPSVIVECGFMSNVEEEKKLNTTEYQEKIAWAIYLGIIDYFSNI